MVEKKFEIEIVIENACDHFINEDLFLTGTFNNWCQNPIYVGKIPKKGERILFTLKEVIEGELEFRFLRGNQNIWAVDAAGNFEAPQIYSVKQNIQVSYTIHSWRDLYPISTASPQVRILSESFFFPRLQRHKRVTLYLPKDYSNSHKKYPVLYMHDGQHLFDESRSVGRAGPIEWKVDETLDNEENPCIVVAIDHAESFDLRKKEYLVQDTSHFENTLGWLYLEDIVHTLKPYIDANYRTFSRPEHTGMVGSSMGGLISIYAGLKYQDIFGSIGSFSPSIWMDRHNLKAYVENLQASSYTDQHMHFYIGGKEKNNRSGFEKDNLIELLDDFLTVLKKNYTGEISYSLNPAGYHRAYYWQNAFKHYYSIFNINHKYNENQ